MKYIYVYLWMDTYIIRKKNIFQTSERLTFHFCI